MTNTIEKKPKNNNMKLTNKFIIVVPVFNAKDLIEKCLMTILSQDFDDLGVIIRDDMSTDGTDKVIRELLEIEGDKAKTKFNDKDVLFIRNESKLYPVGNTYESVIHHVDNDDSIIGVVDGDDSLLSSNAVKKIYDLYASTDKWMIWSQHRKSTGEIGESKPLPSNEQIYNGRNYWSVSHFRTNKAFLFGRLNPDDLKDPFLKDSYFTFAGDAAFLFPFCEMCGNEKSEFLNEVLYLYNNNLPTNEHNKSIDNAIKYGSYVRTHSKRYARITNL
jgi:glycosyltransferase involved in cell wall biosynthesis